MSLYLQRTAPKVTIVDVARTAGVSRATVSRVMNGLSSVDAMLAAKVHAAAHELGYVPSRTAQSLSTGSTGLIGLLVPDLGNPTFQMLLHGLTRAAARPGGRAAFRVLVADSAEDPCEEPALARELRKACDGLVLCAPRMPDVELEAILPELYPVVLTNRSLGTRAAPVLSIDYAAGVRDAISHLVALGHANLAYLAGPAGAHSNQERLRGVAAHPGVAVGDVSVTVLPCGVSVAAGIAVAETVAALREDGITAVIAFNDLVAIGLMSGLQNHGCTVPHDLAVVGCDDIEMAQFANPPLTTLAVPLREVGRLAWTRLEALLAGVEPGHNLALRPTIVPRDSSSGVVSRA